MKNKVLYLVCMAILGVSSVKAQLNVGSTSAADASAILQATSTTKGFLPPVMTTTQINAIGSPANGLTVYNSTLSQLQVNVGTPAVPSWSVAAGGANVYWSQAGNTGSVPGTNYLGTTDNSSLGFRTNGVERVRIDSATGRVGIGTTTPQASLDITSNMRLGTTISGATTDSILTINATTGIVNKRSVANVVRQNVDSSIYNSDGTLTGNRVISVGTNSLTLAGTGLLSPLSITTSTSNISNITSEMYAPNLPIGGVSFINFGKSNTVKNRGELGFYYVNNSNDSNYLSLGFNSVGSVLTATAGRKVGISITTPTATLDVNGAARIRSIPTSTATQYVTTDASGNLGQRALSPTIFGTKDPATTLTINNATSSAYTGFSITIPANSNYIVTFNIFMPSGGTFVNNSTNWIVTTLSTSPTTLAYFSSAGYNYVPTGVNGGSANNNAGSYVSVNANSPSYQMMTGNFFVKNPNSTPLTLYHFVTGVGPSGGYNSTVVMNGVNGENSIVGTPIQ